MEGLQATIGDIGDDVKNFITEKPITTAGIGVGVLGTTAIILATAKGVKTRKKTRKKTSKGRRRDRKFISKQKHERNYIKRKRKAGKKITRPRYKTRRSGSKKRVGKTYFTKKGQPYKITSSGKAKFIKKKRR